VYVYVWLCMAIYDYVWPCITLYDYVWPGMTIYDSVWLYMTLFDSVWTYVIVWLGMTVHCIWLKTELKKNGSGEKLWQKQNIWQKISQKGLISYVFWTEN